MENKSYLTAPRRGIVSWLTTTDHKRIGVLYLVSIMVFFVVAAGLGLMLRLELFSPGEDFLAPAAYNRVLTLHGVIMIFLFIIPSIPATFGNFFLPIMIGAEDVSFPRLNLASWYFYIVGAVLAVISAIWFRPDTGWTFYVPYAATAAADIHVPLIAAFVIGWSSILTGINFITTVHRLRAPGVTFFRMPLFVWSLYATAWIQVLATPVIAITLVMVLLERYLGVPLFDPARGGDPILYQHLFWIYSHPAVYIMILPAMGVISEIIPTFARKAIFGYKFIAYSSIAIASIGSLVWAHHMFTSGMADMARIVFSFLTFIVAVPSAIKVCNWLATLYKGSIQVDPPMFYALAFIILFSVGGLTGLVLGALAQNIHLHDTAFVVGHFHFTMFGGAAMGFFAGLHYWMPKMFGRRYNKRVATAACILFIIGFILTYLSLMVAGVEGNPRRVADYLPEYTAYHRTSTVGAVVMVSSLALMFGNLLVGLFRPVTVEDDPWGGATIEWRIPSPPPPENFVGEPDLRRGPYDYPGPGSGKS